MLTVTLYMREDCHLCEQAKTDLESLQEQYPHRLVEVDIDSDSALQRAYLVEIPVVEVGPYQLKAPFDRQKLMVTLGAANDRRNQLEELGGETYEARVRRGQEISGADRAMLWISRHYLAILNFIMLLYVGLPFLAPVLMHSGATAPARVIYTIYSPLCHQFGFRSFFLYGEQAYYPLEEASIEGVLDFESATGPQRKVQGTRPWAPAEAGPSARSNAVAAGRPRAVTRLLSLRRRRPPEGPSRARG